MFIYPFQFNLICCRRRIMYYYMEIFKKVDVIVTPTTGMTAPIIPPSALKFGETDMQVSGPTIHDELEMVAILHVGHDKQGLPIGLQLIGRPWGEASILRLASAVEGENSTIAIASLLMILRTGGTSQAITFNALVRSGDRLSPEIRVMVKAVVGEETQLKLAEDRLFQSGVPAQVGLVIGKLSSALDRGFVFDLVPTPSNDCGEPACLLSESGRDDKRKASKGKPQVESSSLVIDKDWVSEHARQVSRMLLGGMNVVGVYVWASDSSFKTSNVILGQTIKGVAEAAPFSENGLDERLLVHISYSPRRWTCRNCMLGSNITSSNLRPCDFKIGRILSYLQTFRCMYNFDIRLPIIDESASSISTLKDVLCNGIICHAKELKGAKAIIDGNLVIDDEPCTSDALHEVELLLPFMKDAPAEVCSQNKVVGVVVFSGTVCSIAYLSPKEPISQALADIKGDIIMSLQSRLDIICDEADGEMDITVDGEGEASNGISTEKCILQLVLHLSRQACSLSFPRRVLVPWIADAFICEYLQPSDTLEVLIDNCKELMSMEAPTDTSTILEPETELTLLTTKSFWGIAVPGYSASGADFHSVRNSDKDSTRKESSRKLMKSIDFNIVAAIAGLLLSILVGLVFFVVKT
ncbi:hypothetical protein HHK36_009653 [Tetracentron sinense]|uniref:Amidase domain-containing protein n=1 Tax=Tetracentron sinense TaxID=13715 RepID=A0A835DLT6_TETSI|nr:hypothetical protein HHK36_009653 [Tetracentron sinense]